MDSIKVDNIYTSISQKISNFCRRVALRNEQKPSLVSLSQTSRSQDFYALYVTNQEHRKICFSDSIASCYNGSAYRLCGRHLFVIVLEV